ncbi:MAG: SDR family NAD(P)-dependent oxidoreductase [Acidobacteria bacterium]|nr:SDR family NAD(P)-dependent oxidoreductase [Acidobacteriota bacterium]
MSQESRDDLEIAIVGMAGRFPGADSVDAFWRNLRAGVESIRDLTDEELRAAGATDAELASKDFVRRAADLAGADLFDAALFGLTPREAGLMDPQIRILLEDAWIALEDAGRLGDRPDLRVGVFAGASPNSYILNNIYLNLKAAEAVGAFQTSIVNGRDYLATHVSYRLDLRGPSLLIQTACSTSLVAIHVACQSLLNHECDVALAGGVSVTVPQTSGYFFEEGGIASPDGRCRAFDASAAGCVKGNGSALVVLRRLGDAIRDRDSIRAVIKGSAINNDGALKVGFTAPGDEGQASVIAEALAAAGVDPSTIGYVETHGTGTTLGDPVEVAALARAFGRTSPGHRCAIGSVKTNVGHLDAAAGVAGLVKAALALSHGEIPPSLHFERPNPKIAFAGTPFHVNAALTRWEANGSPRRAGVSSFGIGGTNAHVVLEEAPPTLPRPARRAAQLLVLSAASEPALAAAAERLAAVLAGDGAPDLADTAYTLQVGRKRLPWRRALVASSASEAAAALRRPSAARDDRRDAEVAFVFPGQGSQHAGMARELHRGEPVFRDVLDRCARILEPILKLDPRKVVFAEGAAANDRLRETAIAQPALFAVEYALARLWMSWGVRPSACAGHSIGEYVAACLAGVMTEDDALRLVAERGRLMGAMPKGAMLATPLSEADLAARLAAHPGLSIAAINGATSCVASGPEGEIAKLEMDLAAGGVACKRLRTSHAFHSAMMDPIVGAFEERVRSVRLSPPSMRFLSNVTGTWITADQAQDPAYWSAHLRRAVRFSQNLAALAEEPSRIILEVGPGTALTSLARRHVGPEATVIASLRHATDGGNDQLALLEAAGALWCAGAAIDWEAFHAGFERRRIPLPAYPFERKRHWIDPVKGGARGEAIVGKNPDMARWFHVPGWRRSLPPAPAEPDGAPWLVLDDGSDLGTKLVLRARERGVDVTTVRAGTRFARLREGAFEIDPGRREHYDELLKEIRAGVLPSRVVHLWCAEGAPLDPGAARDLGFFSLLHLAQAMGISGATGDLRVAAIARALFDVAGDAVVRPERAALLGICRVAPQEYAGAIFRLVDPGDAADHDAAASIEAELASSDREPVVAWRGGHRWIPAYEPVRIGALTPDAATAAARGAFLFTGGTGAIEMALARRLASTGARSFTFLGCDASAEESVRDFRKAGLDVLCSHARLDDAAAVAAALGAARARTSSLTAAFHTAGPIGGGMIQLKTREAAERVLAPRLEGAPALARHMQEGETLVLFSSAISATGVFGQSDYCAASCFLDAFAQSRRGAAGPRVVAIDWGTAAWDRWEAATSPALLAQLRDIQSSIGISIDEGVEATLRALSLDQPQIVVTTQDLAEMVREAGSATLTEFLEGLGPESSGGAARDGRPLVEPAGETERRVATVWSALLGVSPIGRDDNFFDLGGNSLLAIQLASQLRKAFDVELTIASLFESGDLKSLAGAVDAALDERRQAGEVAALLAEIERMSEEQVRDHLARDAGAEENRR